MNDVNHFLEHIETILDEKEISLLQLADLMGVPISTISPWFNRESVMELDEYHEILDNLSLED